MILPSDSIFVILTKLQISHHRKELHSFRATIKDGFVYVECRGYEVYVETHTTGTDGEERTTQFCGTTVAAANRLEMLGINMATIEMREQV